MTAYPLQVAIANESGQHVYRWGIGGADAALLAVMCHAEDERISPRDARHLCKAISQMTNAAIILELARNL